VVAITDCRSSRRRLDALVTFKLVDEHRLRAHTFL
jgi:hypothetical protein